MAVFGSNQTGRFTKPEIPGKTGNHSSLLSSFPPEHKYEKTTEKREQQESSSPSSHFQFSTILRDQETKFEVKNGPMPELTSTRTVRVVAPTRVRVVVPGVRSPTGTGVGGYGIFRGTPPGRVGGRRIERVRTPEEDKENIPPAGGRRRRRTRGSPLPSWYPRTPLRDITAIVNAIDRRRARLRQRAQQRTEEADHSPADVQPSGLIQQEPNAAENNSPSDSELPCVSSENPVCEVPSILFPGLSSPMTPAIRCKTASDEAAIAEKEDKLNRSINLIEKLLNEKQKKIPQGTIKASKRKTLMSMR